MRQYLFKGKVRTSTLILLGVFILVFALYLLVRPDHRTAAQKQQDKVSPKVASTSQAPSPTRSSAPPNPSASAGSASPHPSRSAVPSGMPSAAATAPSLPQGSEQPSGQGQAPAPKPPAQLNPQPQPSR
jgi:cytoskeletal protein RodZ